MFLNCSSLNDLNLKSFDTSLVENMEGMFESCGNLNNLNLTSFNTEKCSNFNNMFKNCYENISVIVKEEHCSNLIEAIKEYANVVIE